MRFVIAQAQFEAHIIAAEITNAEKVIDAVTTRSWRQRSANAALALQAMLSRIDHIHPAVVVSACNAKVLVDGLISDLELFEKEKAGGGKEVPQVIVRDIVEVHRNLAELLDQFDLRLDGARDALDRGGDMLPVREWSNRKRRG